MKRTPLKRTGSLKRKTPLKQVSDKRKKLNRERSKFVKDTLTERPNCQAGLLIMSRDDRHRCFVTSVDVHEVVTRARGGSIVDPDNVLAICRSCHDWIHDNPRVATELSLLKSNKKNLE